MPRLSIDDDGSVSPTPSVPTFHVAVVPETLACGLLPCNANAAGIAADRRDAADKRARTTLAISKRYSADPPTVACAGPVARIVTPDVAAGGWLPPAAGTLDGGVTGTDPVPHVAVVTPEPSAIRD